MAASDDAFSNYEVKDLRNSLRAASLELNLERSKHSVEMVAKDEDIRKLRVSQCLLQDQVDDLHEQLEEEQTRSDDLEDALDKALLSLDQYKANAELTQKQIRTQSREVGNLKAELKAMENITSDSNKILSEKLALTREMSSLRPEVEHLRAQVESNQGLLTEKLSLQRQLTTLQVELDNEKRSAARAVNKHEKKNHHDDDLRVELEELRTELAKEKKDRSKAEATLARAEKVSEQVRAELDSQQQTTERVQAKLDKLAKKEAGKSSKRHDEHDAALDDLRQALEQEKSARQAAENAAQNPEQRNEVEELRRQLDQERRERNKAEKVVKKGSQLSGAQTDDLRKELEDERRERKQAEKEYQKTLAEMQGRNTVLDDKLNAFRDKLRSTKEKLKEKEAELEKAQVVATVVKPSVELGKKSAKNPRKRAAATVEPEAINLGTPGDGFPAKKAKRATSVSATGDMSAFSLTPFLNRKGGVAPGETILEESEDEDDAPAPELTPTAPPKQAARKVAQPKSKKPLAPSASNKANAKPVSRKKTVVPTLEMVTEETSEVLARTSSTLSHPDSENAPITVPLKDADDGQTRDKTMVPKIKPRKSLMSFATFTEEPAAEKKKKRKLGSGTSSGLGKTLFDADEDAVPAKPNAGKSIFAARALGKSVLAKGPSRPISGGYNMMSEQNFTFSPLKKDRRSANTSMFKA